MSRTKVCVLLFCLCLVLAGCSKHKTETQDLYTGVTNTSSFNSTQVIKGDFVKEQSFNGDVYFPTKKLLSFQSEGQQVIFVKYLVDYDEEVKEGTPLAEFIVNYDEFALLEKELNVKRAEEDYQKNLSAFEKAISDIQADYESLNDGYKKETQELILEKKKLEYSQYKYNSEQKISMLKKELEDYESKISITQLYAPYDGIIAYLDTRKKDGDIIRAEDILVMIYSEEEILFQVNDMNNELRYNMEVSIGFVYKGEDYIIKGRVVSNPSTLSNKDNGYLVTIKALDQLDKDIKWSELGAIAVKAKPVIMKEVLMADMDAVYIEDGATYVKVLDGNAIHIQSIIIADNNGEDCWILQGVKEGQTLIMK